MRTPLLIQPDSGGRLSGGFLYNALMAQHGLWQLRDVPAAELPAAVAAVPEERPVLMDSIWLTEQHAQPFLERRARGLPVGLMLHSFPTLIVAAESGLPAPSGPSAFEREAASRLGVVVVPGQHYAASLEGCSAQLVVAAPGIDDGFRAPPRPRQGPCRLVSVGAATPRKGFLDVAEILAARAKQDYHWTVIGSLDVDRAYASRLEQRARELGKTEAGGSQLGSGEPCVELCGQLPPVEVQRRVRESHILLMPSYDENQPLVLLEAQAASVPSVAYAAGAARDMVAHERQGLIAEVGDRAAFAAFLARLLEDEALRYRMAEACWQRQQELPSWPETASQASAVLAQALASRR